MECQERKGWASAGKSHAGDPRAHPGLKWIAGLQVRGANSIALLQLCNAVPVIQLLGLILASAHVEAVPSWGGQGHLSKWGWKSEGGGSRLPTGPGISPAFAATILSTSPVDFKPSIPESCSARAADAGAASLHSPWRGHAEAMTPRETTRGPGIDTQRISKGQEPPGRI